jgi:hypothetical protein
MKTERLALAITIINLVILAVVLVRVRPAVAEHGVVPVLRGHSLEIIDDHGRVRSQILVTTPTTMPDGKSYPEGALFRLIDPNGRPAVKIGGSAEGSGISLAGDSERREWSGVQILADGSSSSVKLTNKDGHQELVTPK